MKISYPFYLAITICLPALAFAALPPAAPLAGGIFRESRNSTLPFNLPAPPVNFHPSLLNVSDPWDMRVHDTPITLEWYGYRDPLPISETHRCVMKAVDEVAQRVWAGYWATPMGQLPYSYSDGNVNLWLRVEPGETLLWDSWSEVLPLFPQYLEANEWRGAQFVILWDEPGETKVVAFGHLLAE